MLKLSNFIKHETKSHSLLRYLLVAAVFFTYFVFISFKYGAGGGILITLLTWSFFLFCTPIADAGFLLDFPIRLLTGFRMIYSEIGVWIFGIVMNVFVWFNYPEIYDDTVILKLFHHIISQPFPYWGIIVLCCIGTFLSIYFGDELVDVAKHKDRKKYHVHMKKYQLIIFAFLIFSIIVLYDFMLNGMGIQIPLF